MNNNQKRIFISDLPESLTQEELETTFSKYGQVTSVDIKKRNELGPHNKSLFFAYVNLTSDDSTLTACFRDFSSKKWHGQYVQLQLARESFLDRLKRERLENESGLKENLYHNLNQKEVVPVPHQESRVSQQGGVESDETARSLHQKKVENLDKKTLSVVSKSPQKDLEPSAITDISSESESDKNEESLDIVIKNNKNKLFSRDAALKIPSTGAQPVGQTVKTNKQKPVRNDNVANVKRLQSLQDMKKNYVAKKSLIKSALTYGTAKPNKKIIFGDNEIPSNQSSGNVKKVNGFKTHLLFEGEEDSGGESDFEANFRIKRQFEGDRGQKLLELQSTYKNDKRFALDERFIEKTTDDLSGNIDVEESLEFEKSEQLKLLEEVLGKKVTSAASSSENKTTVNKSMVKFDPLQPAHSNLLINPEETAQKPKKNKKEKDRNLEDEASKRPEPEVSKEVFYKVPEKLKDTFTETAQFSLLSAFGRSNEEEELNEEKATDSMEVQIGKKAMLGKNPFKYDSSDEEDEIADIPHKDDLTKATQRNDSAPRPTTAHQSVFWTEPFFFKNDDFRLQEGLDFVEKMRTDSSKEFTKLRRDVKSIVRAKVKNTERKNKMFKKKLGGNKRRKHVKIKKALKR